MRIRPCFLLPVGLALLVALAACSSQDTPLGPAGRSGAIKTELAAADAAVGDYVVTFEGREFDGQQTTFRWTVRGTGVEPSLRWFLVELPDCAPAPVAWEPTGRTGIYTFAQWDVTGFKWVLRVDPGNYAGQPYALTFPGDVPAGEVRALVTTIAGTSVGGIIGPCGGYAVEGDVFIDNDGDGVRGPTEGGIPNVIVEIVAADASVDTVRTDGGGHFSTARAAGTYTLRIDTGAYPGAFNPTLGEHFIATTPLELEVTVGPDSFGNDFGFEPDVLGLIDDLEQDVLPTDGEDYRWWKRQLYAAISASDGDDPYEPMPGFYSPAQLLEFIQRIEQLALPQVFDFTPGQELQEAYAILRNYPDSDLAKLYRELLTAEFNHVSGRGLWDIAPDLQLVLIAWGETYWYEYEDPKGGAKSGGTLADKADENLLAAIRLFRGINTGGGGGIDE